MKRPALQNKQVVLLRMAFRARKVLGTFERRAPGQCNVIINSIGDKLQSNLDYPDLDYPDFSIIRTFSLVPIWLWN